MAMYSYGFNSNVGNILEAKMNLYFFKSTDYARTWEFISQIIFSENSKYEESIGLQEPNLLKCNNGDFLVFIRTGSGMPCLYSRSDNKCKKWSEPIIFDDIGVKPQSILLPDGVAIVSYGRPGIYIKASGSKDASKWISPLKLDISGDTVNESLMRSCCYTSMISIGNDEALIVYSDFNFNNEDKKTILIQKITVTPY